jgi:isopenicillin N synthase-like dioxygenase
VFIKKVPRAVVPGLQILDLMDMGWVSVEKLSQKTDIIIFNSECIDRMTAGYYPACMHRVVS